MRHADQNTRVLTMKPIARVVGYHAGRCVIEPTNPADVLPTGMALFDAAPEVKQESVAFLSLDCIGERYLCFSKPVDNDPVTPLYAYPPDAQAEIAKRDKRIKELEQQVTRLKTVPMKYRRMEFNAQLQRENTEQAAEISRLKGVIAKCKWGINQYLKDHPHSPPDDCYATGPITGSPVFDLVRCPGCDADTNFKEALASIKEIDHATD